MQSFGKLKAAFAKAEKIANPKAATAAFNALLGPAQALRARADGAKNAEDWVQKNVSPLIAPAQAGIDALAAAPKAVLQRPKHRCRLTSTSARTTSSVSPR